jgi:hypothetical protein
MKAVQATAEAFSPQKKISSTSKQGWKKPGFFGVFLVFFGPDERF